MKKLSTMLLAVLSVLGFSVAAVLPNALAVGFLVEGLGVTVVTKLISALILLGFAFLALNPLIA